MSTKALSSAYLSAVAPVNAALGTFQAALNNLSDSASGSDLAKVAAPLASALRTYDNELLRLGATGQAEADARALVSTDAKLEGVLDSAGAQTGLSASTWASSFSSEIAQASSAANVLRADLGLPPVKS